MKITSILLASGFSKRMGKDKLLLEIKGEKIYKIIIDKISKVKFYQNIIITNNEEIKNYALSKDFEVYENLNASEGKSESIKIGIRNIKDAEACMIFVADQPFLKKETIENLIDFYKSNTEYIVYPSIYGEKASPTIIPSKYFKYLTKLYGDKGGAYIVNNINSKKFYIENNNELIDIDTDEDFQNILEK